MYRTGADAASLNATTPALRASIEAAGRALGFDAIGVADVDLTADEQRLEAWLARVGVAGADGRLLPRTPAHPLLQALERAP